MLKYEIRTDKHYFEEIGEAETYGIDVIGENGKIEESILDISFDKEKIMGLVSLCNEEEVEAIHLRDIIEDFFACAVK